MSTSSARCSRAWSSRASPPPRAFAKPAPGPFDRRSLAAHPLLLAFARSRRSGRRLFGPGRGDPQALGMAPLRPGPRRTPGAREGTASARAAASPGAREAQLLALVILSPRHGGDGSACARRRGSPKQIPRCARYDTSLVRAAENPWHSGGTASRVGHPEPPARGRRICLYPAQGKPKADPSLCSRSHIFGPSAGEPLTLGRTPLRSGSRRVLALGRTPSCCESPGAHTRRSPVPPPDADCHRPAPTLHAAHWAPNDRPAIDKTWTTG
jgi:hypothetical protein